VAKREQLTVTEDGVTRTVRRWLRSNLDEAVRWEDLQSVDIVSEASLGGDEDLFLLLNGRGSGVVVGYNLARSAGVLARLEALPGYDQRSATDVISSTFGRAELWSREQANNRE
jgi:hypothetical protein